MKDGFLFHDKTDDNLQIEKELILHKKSRK